MAANSNRADTQRLIAADSTERNNRFMAADGNRDDPRLSAADGARLSRVSADGARLRPRSDSS
jgi:hypothetical protein